jgi:hypothetical protein
MTKKGHDTPSGEGTYDTLSVLDRMRVGATLDAKQDRTLLVSGTLEVQNETEFHGPLTARASLSVQKHAILDGALTVSGAATLNDGLAVNGATTLNDGLTVSKATTLTDALTVAGNVAIGTPTPENAEKWQRVLDIWGKDNAKLSVRSANIDARVLAHESGWWSAPAGMIIGTKSEHPLSFATCETSRMVIDANGNVGIGTTSLGAKLEVRGSIKLHTDGSLFAAAGVENLTIIGGMVNSDGSIVSGGGFKVSAGTVVGHIGEYTITFDVEFSGKPTAMVIPAEPNKWWVTTKTDTKQLVVVTGAENSVDSKGKPFGSPHGFTFVVIGPR